MDDKIKEIDQKPSSEILKDQSTDLFKLSSDITLEKKINMLLKMLDQARLEERPLKKAFIEEELQLTG